MDRGYKNYSKFHEWNIAGIHWVTRMQSNSVFEVTKDRLITEHHKKNGIASDQNIILGFKNKKIQQVKCRLIRYYDEATKRVFAFLTNNFLLSPVTIAEIYKRRGK